MLGNGVDEGAQVFLDGNVYAKMLVYAPHVDVGWRMAAII